LTSRASGLLSVTFNRSQGNNTMIKTYGLAIDKAHALTVLNLPLMTLAQAEQARDSFASWGKIVLVINRKAV